MLVTGSTRSGTSLAAGTLSYLGLHVPLPVLRANESNPRGFFESKWPVRFHRRLMDTCLVAGVDARPEVFDVMADAVGPDERSELRAWIQGVFDEADQVVVKDPRAAWVPGLWVDTVEALGGRAGILLMVRHPAEVIASRTTYYASRDQQVEAWRYRVRNLCGWINVNTGAERATRDRPRVVARYTDVLEDWRGVIGRVGGTFDIELKLDEGGAEPHPVDAFVDPGLRRHAPTWDGMDMPAPLIEIADGVWSAMSDLAAGRANDEVTGRLDAARAAFVDRMRVAEAMTVDVSTARVRAERQARAAGPVAGAAAARIATRPKRGGVRRNVSQARRLARALIPIQLRRLSLRARGKS